MLVLSRRNRDGIRIGEDIRITVVKIDSQGVRIGVEAPRSVSVVRNELIESGHSRTKPVNSGTRPRA